MLLGEFCEVHTFWYYSEFFSSIYLQVVHWIIFADSVAQCSIFWIFFIPFLRQPLFYPLQQYASQFSEIILSNSLSLLALVLLIYSLAAYHFSLSLTNFGGFNSATSLFITFIEEQDEKRAEVFTVIPHNLSLSGHFVADFLLAKSAQ